MAELAVFRLPALGYSAKPIILNSFELKDSFGKLMKPTGFHPQGEKNQCLFAHRHKIFSDFAEPLKCIHELLGIKNSLRESKREHINPKR